MKFTRPFLVVRHVRVYKTTLMFANMVGVCELDHGEFGVVSQETLPSAPCCLPRLQTHYINTLCLTCILCHVCLVVISNTQEVLCVAD